MEYWNLIVVDCVGRQTQNKITLIVLYSTLYVCRVHNIISNICDNMVKMIKNIPRECQSEVLQVQRGW